MSNYTNRLCIVFDYDENLHRNHDFKEKEHRKNRMPKYGMYVLFINHSEVIVIENNAIELVFFGTRLRPS